MHVWLHEHFTIKLPWSLSFVCLRYVCDTESRFNWGEHSSKLDHLTLSHWMLYTDVWSCSTDSTQHLIHLNELYLFYCIIWIALSSLARIRFNYSWAALFINSLGLLTLCFRKCVRTTKRIDNRSRRWRSGRIYLWQPYFRTNLQTPQRSLNVRAKVRRPLVSHSSAGVFVGVPTVTAGCGWADMRNRANNNAESAVDASQIN